MKKPTIYTVILKQKPQKGRVPQYWHEIKSRNGQIMSSGELCTRKANVQKAAKKFGFPIFDETGEAANGKKSR